VQRKKDQKERGGTRETIEGTTMLVGKVDLETGRTRRRGKKKKKHGIGRPPRKAPATARVGPGGARGKRRKKRGSIRTHLKKRRKRRSRPAKTRAAVRCRKKRKKVTVEREREAERHKTLEINRA